MWYFGLSAEYFRCGGPTCLVGSTGSSQSPQAGAFILPLEDSLDFDLEIDAPDTLERTEDVDSKESRLELWTVVRLCGNAGHGCDDCRFGSGGGGGFDLSAPFCTIGGGDTFPAFVPFGELPNVLSWSAPFVCSGRLLIDVCRCSINGLSSGI